MNGIRLTLSCSGRFPNKRLVSVRSCFHSSCRRVAYHLNYDRFATLESKKKRSRCLMLSTSSFHSHEIPASGSFTRKQLATNHVDDLMKKDIGSFKYPNDYHAAHECLMETLKDDNPSSKAINMSVHLLERMAREFSHYFAVHIKDLRGTQTHFQNSALWFCNPVVISSVFNQWKNAALRNEDVPSPRDMVQKLQNMAVLLPEHFRCDIMTMNIIMQVLIRTESPHRAPFVAENLFDFISAEHMARAAHGDNSMEPTVHTYCMLLQAWSQSRLSNAAARMEQIMETVHRKNCANPQAAFVAPYSIWIRYWSNFGNVEKVDAILALLDSNEQLRAKVGCFTLSDAIFCYTKDGKVKKAEGMYDRMISVFTSTRLTANSANINKVMDEDDTKGLMLGSFYLMDCYRKVIVSTMQNHRVIPQGSLLQIRQYTERAEAVLRQVEEFREIDPSSVGKL